MDAEFGTDMKLAKALWEKYRSAKDPNKLEGYEADILAIPEPQRKAVTGRLMKLADRDIRRLSKEKTEILTLSERGQQIMDETTSLYEWRELPHILERPAGSCLHHVRQAIADKQAFLLNGKIGFSLQEFGGALAAANCFVVEHDWAKAFAGATDFAEGDIRLPYEICAFDFKISGRRVMALMTTVDDDTNDILMQVMVRGRDMWAVDDDICRHHNGAWSPIGAGRTRQTNQLQRLADFIGAQVRAVTIALDAQVAESEVVRVNEKLARSREKSGHVPPKPYHIVSLARRSRAAPLASSGEPEHGKVRLHFRRGHWRHYEDHKTWIRWMLVGNPDLGFVDKEYRL